MDLESKIRLMKDLIKENRDITIGEYDQTVKEIESVEHKTESMYIQTTAGIIETRPQDKPADPHEAVYDQLALLKAVLPNNQKAAI